MMPLRALALAGLLLPSFAHAAVWEYATLTYLPPNQGSRETGRYVWSGPMRDLQAANLKQLAELYSKNKQTTTTLAGFLNLLGKDSWELVGVHPDPERPTTSQWWVFKREGQP